MAAWRPRVNQEARCPDACRSAGDCRSRGEGRRPPRRARELPLAAVVCRDEASDPPGRRWHCLQHQLPNAPRGRPGQPSRVRVASAVLSDDGALPGTRDRCVYGAAVRRVLLVSLLRRAVVHDTPSENRAPNITNEEYR